MGKVFALIEDYEQEGWEFLTDEFGARGRVRTYLEDPKVACGVCTFSYIGGGVVACVTRTQRNRWRWEVTAADEDEVGGTVATLADAIAICKATVTRTFRRIDAVGAA